MADKKDPPFFNEDNAGPFHFKLPYYDTMELFIETLTGTCFELRVSPFETVISVKAKIQRLEGIPVAQQHLIWNNMELEDEYCLHDYNIAEGCTLKLVLAMRGGPINTRRVTVEDSVKEMAEYMEAGRDDAWEKAPPTKQVTYLVYREGDQLNFFRVVDRGDGTLTPVSESVRGSSIYNLYAEEEEEAEGSAAGQQALENSITMTKMKLLKAKMENMNLNKKPKKAAKLKPRPPVGPRPCSGYLAPSRHHRPFRVLPQIGQSLAPMTHLPPAQDQQATAPGSAHLSLSSRPVLAPVGQAVLRDVGEEPWDCSALSKIRPPPKVSRLEAAGSTMLKDRMLPPLSVLANRGLSEGVMEETQPKVGGVTLIEESVLADPQKTLSFGDSRPDHVTLDLSPQEIGGRDSSGPVAEQVPVAPLLSQVVGSNCMDTWAIGAQRVSNKAQLGPLQTSPDPSQCPPQPFDYTADSFWSGPSRSLLKAEERPALATVSSPRPTRLQGIRMDSPGKHPELISKSEARDITEKANRSSKEPLGSVSNAALLASLARSRSRDGGLGRLCTAAVPLSTSIHLIQEDLLLGPGAPFMSANGLPAGPSSSIRRIGTPTYLLPPVKPPVGPKKKSSKQCYLCGKKTGLATSFECRCGNNFCAVHRYAETHDCSYDYKGAGRRFLQETNPIITAPKLPKI
ncbi:hypothetical protein AGOR_G00115050 [Albula goreensis]|uniref:AN1-type zinc finger protein 4 n=1 Tax=Albula goreensis TaxID=1534307 RepID=A0A8T3DF38_9TELE|nr:hypothetical protein AGOR_G00115050 [Albula goreensis]